MLHLRLLRDGDGGDVLLWTPLMIPHHLILQLKSLRCSQCLCLQQNLAYDDRGHHVDGDDIVVDLDAFTVRFTDRTWAPPATAAAGSDGTLRAPMDGRIVAIKVAAGDSVVRGQTLVVLEAMKIQHQLKAGVDARIETVAVSEGQQVSNRTVLVTMAATADAAAS